MRRYGLIGTALMLGMLTGLAAPHAIADEITLNVPVRLTRMAVNVTRGLVTCDFRAQWLTRGTSGAADDIQYRPLQGSGTSEFTIDGASGEYNGTRTVRITTPPPPREWIDAGALIAIVPLMGTAVSYFCRVQVATADSTWQPQITLDPGTGMFSGYQSPPPAWAAGAGVLAVTGALSVTPPPR